MPRIYLRFWHQRGLWDLRTASQGPATKLFTIEAELDCWIVSANQFRTKSTVLLAFHWNQRIQTIVINWGFFQKIPCGLTIETNCSKSCSVWKLIGATTFEFPPADPNSLYGRLLCVHAHIQGPKSRKIALMHSKGAFRESYALVLHCTNTLW